MNARSKKSKRRTSRVISRRTSSQASAGGPTRSDSRAGPTTAPSGLEVALANRSVVLESVQRSRMRGIFGLFGWGSSPSGRLQSSLESRLKPQLAGAGSILYSQSWKRKLTPAGRPYFQLVASARHTLGSGLIGWPTPIKRDGVSVLGGRRAPNATGAEPLIWVAALVSGLVKENRSGLKMGASVGLNPEFVSWLMGFLTAWLKSAPLVTQLSRKSQRSSSKQQM